MSLIDFPSLKIGPGDSARSHIADEFIFVNEIEEGIKTYIDLLRNFATKLKD
jgi:acetylornithine deacetylase